jgi:hypothetical protein
VAKIDPSSNVLQLVKEAIKRVMGLMNALEVRVIEKLDTEKEHSKELREAMKDASKADIQSAVARAEALAKQQEELVKRVSAIEVAQSQNQGKSLLTDPMLEDLLKEMKIIRESNSSKQGSTTGYREAIAYVIAFVMAAIAILGIIYHTK